jgi:hypothetical protein
MKAVTRNLHSDTLAETAFARREAPTGPAHRLLGGLTLLAAAVALVLASAAPTRANERSDNIAKIIVGALIVGAIANELKDDRRPPAHQPVRDKRPPRACAISIDSRERGGDVTLYGGNCLRQHGWRDLPSCGRSMTIYGQRDRLYSPDCLRRGR